MSCGKDLVCDACGNDDCSKFEQVNFADETEYQCTECGNRVNE